jgi:UDP-N-acetylglucosamine acyltransferase
MNPQVHPSASIAPDVVLGPEVEIGPFVVLEKNVKIGFRSKIGPHAVIGENTTVGSDNNIFAHACLGLAPQDFKYKGEKSFLTIGDGNTIREFVTMHRATGENQHTVVGNNNFFMNYCHVAHNCVLGNNITIANCTTLAGHVRVEDYAFLSGLTGLHQFTRVGRNAMVGALSRLSKDVLPFSVTSGCDQVEVYGINKVGLRRNNFSKAEIENLQQAFRILSNSKVTATEALAELEAFDEKKELVEHLIKFIKNSSRGYYR